MSALTSPPKSRQYLPADFTITSWETLKPYFDELLQAEAPGMDGLRQLISQVEELIAVVQEEMAWRYIRMTCDTHDEEKREHFQHFVQHIQPQLSEYSDKLNRKLVAHPQFNELPIEPFLPFVRGVQRDIELYREENIVLTTETQNLTQQYTALVGGLSIEHNGQELTLQQAGKLLEEPDRTLRQQIWENISARRLQDREACEDIYDQLVQLRTRIAQHAGYESFTAYKFDALNRFDYSLADTHAFHDTVANVVRPIYETFMRDRKAQLGLETLRPWDLQVDMHGGQPLQPFQRAEELRNGAIRILSRLRPDLGEKLQIMGEQGFLDLESRKGKAPGGYNYPLAETGIPFIFMNAAGTATDVITLLHESGHAIHSFAIRELPLFFQQLPSEVAELAAMSMELLALDKYDEFYPDPADRARAQKDQLVRCITVLPWIATIDAFQQWAYDHPDHSREERATQFAALYRRFHGDEVDWSGYETALAGSWIKQGHVFEVPFYYIEYGIAQLGALAIWRNYQHHPQQALTQYLAALSLGYTRTIPEIYETAGIRFDFSEEYLRSAVEDCLAAYRKL